MNIDVLNNNEIIIDIPKTTGYFIIKQEKNIRPFGIGILRYN